MLERRAFSLGLCLLVFAVPVLAAVAPAPDPLFVRDPDLYIPNVYQPLQSLDPVLALGLRSDLEALGVSSGSAFYDVRGGRWGTLIQSRPLIPGSGRGNTLTWADLGLAAPSGGDAFRDAVWTAFTRYLAANRVALGIDPAELSPRAGVTVHEGGRIVQIHASRVAGGVPVRSSYLSAVINGGNLVLLGARNWGTIASVPQPAVSAEAAAAVVRAHAGSRLAGFRAAPGLVLVPLANGADLSQVVPGTGYAYRLAWVLQAQVTGSRGSWEALVDAASGEILSFTDTNQYLNGKVVGGVYPVSNDGQEPDGVEQPGFPMPYANLVRPFQPDGFTNSSGTATQVGSVLTTTLLGPYVGINDLCGPIRERGTCGALDLGSGAGTDCAVPPGSSPGNTHSARSGFYEVNRIVESAKGWIPDNPWLHEQLTANMNIPESCNAFWDGLTINFYRSGDGCGNTGEIAAVFDHEWGHGLDNNNTNPDISSPGEAIADIFALLRLADSCVGRGFLADGTTCGGDGDPCLTCTGVRELDFAKHASGQPHDIDWILSPTVAPGGGCAGVPGIQFGPCNQETHCEGHVPAEAGWDLVARDLRASHDFNTALEIGTRLFYLGSGNVGSWYQCIPGPTRLGGCNADGGYLNLLAVDDDNGDLEDGTPHMAAIFSAFDRHQIACSTPAVADSGCSGAPAQAPLLSVTPVPGGAELSWSAVPGAHKYWVFRTEGVKGCDFGKVKIAETTGTSFTDTGLLDGFTVFYSVAAVGAQDSCMGPMSACAAAVPPPPPPAIEALLGFAEVADPLQILTGDDDPFLDNCERAQFRLQVENIGSLDVHNVRITSIVPVSHPGIEILTPVPLPLAAVLPAPASCNDTGPAVPVTLSFRAHGLGADETVVLRIEVVSDETSPVVGTIRLPVSTEGDFQHRASHTFQFETDLEGWRVTSGTFDRTVGPGGAATLAYVASSSFLAGQCDRIESPLLRLSPTSTLSVWNQFEIEPMSTGFFDRANVGLLEPLGGFRTTVSPDGGRTYNASGSGGVCVTASQPGWAGAGPGWLPATWSAKALQAGAFAGRPIRLDVAYGTDPAVELNGFWFDEVTLTDVDIQVADAQSEICPAFDAPIARDDHDETLPGTPVTVDVLANDSTVNPPLAVDSVGQPAHGTASAGPGGITYSPETGFTGSDTFSYTTCDASGLCDSAQVTVQVSCPPAATGGFEDDFEPLPGPGWEVDTAANEVPASATWTPVADPFAQSPAISFFSDATTLDVKDDRLVAPPQDLSEDSHLIFWHRFFFEPGFDGGVLEVSRDGGSTWVDVLAGGGSFVEGGYNSTISGAFGSPIAGRPAWSDSSEFIDAMSRVEVDLGAFAGEGVLVRWRLGADQLFVGSLPGTGWWIDDVQFTGVLETPAACPLPPRAADDTAETRRDTAVVIDVLANDVDPNGDPLSVGGVDQPANGTAATDGATVTYTPAAGFVGTDTFHYTACDPGGLCATASVTVLVREPTTGGPTRASGNGSLPGAPSARFHFSGDSTASGPKGRLSYTAGSLRLSGVLETLTFPSTNRASFGGSCEYGEGLACRFSAAAEDHGEPGSNGDRFEIQVFDAQGNPIHQNGGAIDSGNVKVR